MSLPITLPSGYVLIYGEGYFPNPSGIAPDNDNWVVGSIYQVWAGGETYIYGGDLVMYDKTAVLVTLFDGNAPYHQVQARLVTKQNPLL